MDKLKTAGKILGRQASAGCEYNAIPEEISQ